jgi:hypothetical protein
MKKRIAAAVALAVALAVTLAARQKPQKPWTEWSKKDAEKVLNDSPWGQTQVETDTSEMFFSPTATPDPSGRRSGGSRDSQGATNQATDVKYRIRLFSSRPIRQAFARMILLEQKQADPQLEERMRMFAEMPSNQKIVVSVSFESKDGRFSGPALQAFSAARAETLKNNTYLERSDGKRIFIEQYAPPGKEGFGALFIFPRYVGEQPFLASNTGDLRFVTEMSSQIKLNMRFNVANLTYNGALEY